MFKRIISFLLITATIFSVGCSYNEKTGDEKIKVITTIFPSFDFVRQLGGENVDVTLLTPLGSDNHSYEPSASDMVAIKNCDLFIYVGVQADLWVENLFKSIGSDVNSMSLFDAVSLIEEEHDHDEHEEHEEHDEHEEDISYDEHVWTSPKNALSISSEITKRLSSIDEKNKEMYEKNLASYTEKLVALETSIESIKKEKVLVFADRFPFRYLEKDYGFTFEAVFPGCSDETEPSGKKVTETIEFVRSNNITTIFVKEFSDKKIANVIAEATNAEIKELHSCHNLSKADFNNGATYVSIMQSNINTISEYEGK